MAEEDLSIKKQSPAKAYTFCPYFVPLTFQMLDHRRTRMLTECSRTYSVTRSAKVVSVYSAASMWWQRDASYGREG